MSQRWMAITESQFPWEQAALPGSILITAELLRLVEGYVQVTALGSVAVKGFTAPVDVIVEDLHWIDAETQARLDTLVERLPTARLFGAPCPPG